MFKIRACMLQGLSVQDEELKSCISTQGVNEDQLIKKQHPGSIKMRTE